MNRNFIRRGSALLLTLILAAGLSACSQPGRAASGGSSAAASVSGGAKESTGVSGSPSAAASSATAPPSSSGGKAQSSAVQSAVAAAKKQTSSAVNGQVSSAAEKKTAASSSPKSSASKKSVSSGRAPAASSASAGTANPSMAAQVLQLVNTERAKNGLGALTMNAAASRAAQVRAAEIVKSFSHTRPDGTSCFTVLEDEKVSYSTAGENIAYGYPDAASVMNGWMNSPEHRANILKSSFRQLGVGVCRAADGNYYWVQEFIG